MTFVDIHVSCQRLPLKYTPSLVNMQVLLKNLLPLQTFHFSWFGNRRREGKGVNFDIYKLCSMKNVRVLI